MGRLLNVLIKEFVIILALWMGGWVLFYAGARGLNDYKTDYWQASVVTKPAFKGLSQKEKDAAYQQFMGLWQVRPGDEPFREGGFGIRLAYGAQASGFWLKGHWLLCYVVLCVLRIGLTIRRSCQKGKGTRRETAGERFSKELRIMTFFAVMAALWVLVWSSLAPSLYVAYQRFYAHSYEYLWNSRLLDFEHLAGSWFYVLLGYPLSLLLRIIWGIRTSIRKRLGF